MRTLLPYRSTLLALLVVSTLFVSVSAQTETPTAPTAKQIKFFENKIRPLLARRCYDCHGPDDQSGSLRLDTFEGLFKGGEAGPPIVTGHPDQSLLIAAVGYDNPELQMPPDEPLAPRELEDLKRWIAIGAPHPDYDASLLSAGESKWETEREFWSFQPVVDSPVPTVRDETWPESELDRFVLAKLESQGLQPAPAADKRTLIRRATFDLIGLPPTPEQVADFLADDSPQAFERVVERLLASRQYGERWARHWLDVVRYADSNGLDENVAHGNAWRYRDYVITSLNRDKPYDQFLTEQLAGDILEANDPSEDRARRDERLIALGYLAMGPKVLAEVDKTKMEMDIIDEQIDTIGRSLMGLTIGCARCHDHKFDPIPTRDYYSLAGIFKSTKTMESFETIARWHENSIATPEESKRQAEHAQTVTELKEQIESCVAEANEELLARLEPDAELPEEPEAEYDDKTKAELKQLRDDLAELQDNPPEISTAMGVEEGEPTDLQVHMRGSHLTLGERVPRGFPQVLNFEPPPEIDESESGRLQLAQWLTNGSHPLTARVMVNRVWRWHFGHGLVRTTDNFGRLGEPPDNPELLDWLASRFVEQGWSIKAMHRLIMFSSVYRMGSDYDPRAAAADPENRLNWRMNVRRLEAEAIRDSLLHVSGLLDESMGGSLLHVENREFFFNHTSEDGTTYDVPRRSIYLPVVRNHLYDVFMLFDYSDAAVLNGDRPSSTVAPQALFLMNAELMHQVSTALAESIRDQATAGERLNELYMTCYSRPPSAKEAERAAEFLDLLDQFRKHGQSQGHSPEEREQQAWATLCQVLLAANEFLYVR